MNAAIDQAVRSTTRMVTVRASALPDFFDCPARAEAKHLLGKRTPMSAAALLGTAIHRSTAVYDRSKIEGQGITVDEAMAAAVDTIHRPDDDVVYEDDESPRVLEKIASALHERYCFEIAPRQQYVAVEVTCERLEISDIGLALTGTTDRVRVVLHSENPEMPPQISGYGIADLKSGKTAVRADGYVETKGHRYQVGVYELLAERASGIPITEGGQIIGLQTGKTERGQRVAISEPIQGARDVLVGERDSPGVLEILARMIHSGTFPGNPRSMLCGAKYCPIYETCKFRK